MLTRVVRVFSDHDWARLVVERVHLVVVDRLCLYLGDEHERVYNATVNIRAQGWRCNQIIVKPAR
jgi:hypothetical protein